MEKYRGVNYLDIERLGSNPGGMKMRAVKEGDSYVLNGAKM